MYTFLLLDPAMLCWLLSPGWCFFPGHRGARSQSHSPRVAPTDIDAAGSRVLRHFRDEAGPCNTTGSKQTPPSKSPLITNKSCTGNSRAPQAEPSRTSVDHEEGVECKAGKSAQRSVSFAVGEPLATGKRSTAEDKKQQQQRPAAEFGERSAQKSIEDNSAYHRPRVPAMGQGPAPFGSEEYLENRRRRAAKGVEVVRQCAAGLDKISSL